MSRRKRNPSHSTVINAALEIALEDAQRRYQHQTQLENQPVNNTGAHDSNEDAEAHEVYDKSLQPSERFAKLKRDLLRSKLTDAFEHYINDPIRYEDSLWMAVLEFATVKLRHLEYEFKETGTANTVDDYAQEVVIRVWKHLPSFKGDASSFYSWVHTIAFNKRTEFTTELIDKKRNYEGLTVATVDADGVEDEVDNPALYADGDDTADFYIPNSVTGIDRAICQLLKETVDRQPTAKNKNSYRGLTWDEIARLLNMTPDAVKKRVDRLKKRYTAAVSAEDELETVDTVTAE